MKEFLELIYLNLGLFWATGLIAVSIPGLIGILCAPGTVDISTCLAVEAVVVFVYIIITILAFLADFFDDGRDDW